MLARCDAIGSEGKSSQTSGGQPHGSPHLAQPLDPPKGQPRAKAHRLKYLNTQLLSRGELQLHRRAWKHRRPRWKLQVERLKRPDPQVHVGEQVVLRRRVYKLRRPAAGWKPH